VTVNSTYNIQEIKVLDVLGNEVINQTANGNAQINVSTLPKGLYNFVITTDKGTGSKKVNVQ
ncbi:MAG TPA: T9SS type A sorting domain-containing protein, partial [Cytophagaceae bacterium]|nr:T9SS type A sorting domain-containing protein [Cytophagaceae bacterium]